MIGEISAFGNNLPEDWLLCDGSAVSRTTYADLFAEIGTTYGVGDGSTTFNLPNLVNRFARCESSPGAGAPGSTHQHGGNSGSHASHTTGTATAAQASSNGSVSGIASHAHSVTSNHSHDHGNVSAVEPTPPYLTARYGIRATQ